MADPNYVRELDRCSARAKGATKHSIVAKIVHCLSWPKKATNISAIARVASAASSVDLGSADCTLQAGCAKAFVWKTQHAGRKLGKIEQRIA